MKMKVWKGLAVLLALLFAGLTACDDGSGGGGGGGPKVVHYLSTAKAGFTIDGADAEGTQFILELARPDARAVYTPQVNDTFELAMRGTDGTVQTFTGNVVSNNNGFVTLDCDGIEISVNITGGDMTGFNGFLPLPFGAEGPPIPIVGELAPYKTYFPDGPGAPEGKTWDDYVREAFEEANNGFNLVIAEECRGTYLYDRGNQRSMRWVFTANTATRQDEASFGGSGIWETISYYPIAWTGKPSTLVGSEGYTRVYGAKDISQIPELDPNNDVYGSNCFIGIFHDNGTRFDGNYIKQR